MARSPELDRKSRHELVEEARALGVERPERLTRVELVDEIVRRTTPLEEQAEARGLFGVARSMLASVIESGLNLPEAASVIRGQVTPRVPAGNQAPVATVTLAEIYAAQGHRQRALRMIEEVLTAEPDHQEALRVRRALEPGAEGARPGVSTETSKAASVLPAMSQSAPPQPSSMQVAATQLSATPPYVPAAFVETIGEEIETGKPPLVAEAAIPAVVPPPVVAPAAPSEGLDEVGPGDQEHASGIMEKPSGADHGLVSDFEEQEHALPVLISSSTEQELRFYWELPRSVLDRCAVDVADGKACLRVVAFTPSGTRPQRQEWTLFLEEGRHLDQRSGVLSLGEVGPPSTVRAALGWLSGDAFLPICVAKPLLAAHADASHAAAAERADRHLRG